MKYQIFFFFCILCCSPQLKAQSETRKIPSKLINGENIKPFIDSLKQNILADTVKFNKKDLIHINGRTVNLSPYSMLISVNHKYNYLLDIINGKFVKEFTDEILNSENIESINLVKKEDAPLLGGNAAKEGLIFINLKPKVNLNFKVGKLKYRKGKKRKGGDNFLQREEREVMIRT